MLRNGLRTAISFSHYLEFNDSISLCPTHSRQLPRPQGEAEVRDLNGTPFSLLQRGVYRRARPGPDQSSGSNACHHQTGLLRGTGSLSPSVNGVTSGILHYPRHLRRNAPMARFADILSFSGAPAVAARGSSHPRDGPGISSPDRPGKSAFLVSYGRARGQSWPPRVSLSGVRQD